jgi:hypothetical protein
MIETTTPVVAESNQSIVKKPTKPSDQKSHRSGETQPKIAERPVTALGIIDQPTIDSKVNESEATII